MIRYPQATRVAAEGVVTQEASDFVARASQKAAYFGNSDSCFRCAPLKPCRSGLLIVCRSAIKMHGLQCTNHQ